MNDTEKLLGMLPGYAKYLDEADVVEISLNPSGDVFVERFGSGTHAVGRMEPAAAERFIRYCASVVRESISAANPILSARVPGTGHRIEALLPPVVAAPTFSIRRHAEQLIVLSDFVDDAAACASINEAIKARQNIVIAGSTGSGKTTFVNSCLDRLATQTPDARLLVLEDTPELQVGIANVVHLQSAPVAALERLLVSSLRLSPTRIILGEVRTGAVLMTLLKSWNTGHPGGLTTIHANSAHETIDRMRLLASEVSVSDQSDFIHQAVDLIIFLSRDYGAPVGPTGHHMPERPSVRQILSVSPSNEPELLYET